MKQTQWSPLYKIRGYAPGNLHAMRKDVQSVTYPEVKLIISGTWLKPAKKFGNLKVFRRESSQTILTAGPAPPQHEYLTMLLAPRIDILKSYIECVANFEEPEALYTTTLSSTLNNTIT